MELKLPERRTWKPLASKLIAPLVGGLFTLTMGVAGYQVSRIDMRLDFIEHMHLEWGLSTLPERLRQLEVRCYDMVVLSAVQTESGNNSKVSLEQLQKRLDRLESLYKWH